MSEIVVQSPYGEIKVEEISNVSIDLDFLEFDLFDNYTKQIALLVFSVVKSRIPSYISFLSFENSLVVWTGKMEVKKYKITTPITEFTVLF